VGAEGQWEMARPQWLALQRAPLPPQLSPLVLPRLLALQPGRLVPPVAKPGSLAPPGPPPGSPQLLAQLEPPQLLANSGPSLPRASQPGLSAIVVAAIAAAVAKLSARSSAALSG
jgi:hypothetical protein